ncbi:hypothetical protein [Ferrimonas balearica]|uniref:hypothetical protein n=1 Tax=Ferrimonas balearica TaxID=44012 RepID=UPI001F1EF2DB|nr:hypothetical protein [Ferrimonas balearica]MBY6019447.1 hypothetical protein [Halomonas denitrificans]MBY6096202.1 hypothetical protein [Ferrimonas balearica]
MKPLWIAGVVLMLAACGSDHSDSENVNTPTQPIEPPGTDVVLIWDDGQWDNGDWQ